MPPREGLPSGSQKLGHWMIHTEPLNGLPGCVPSNSRLHTDEQLRGAYGAPPSLAGEPNVGWARGVGRT